MHIVRSARSTEFAPAQHTQNATPQPDAPLRVEHNTTETGAHHGPQRSRLGPFLCWAIVFADIGTSVYYTPGILYHQVGLRAALFVGMTTVVFVLLVLKYREVSARYPEGGGVVTVSARAIHPFVGLLGGMFILVDYFLTAAISALSGILYLSVVAPSLKPIATEVTIAALIILGILNWVGISESAKVSAIFATLAFASQGVVVLSVILYEGPGRLFAAFPRIFSGPHLTPLTLLTGYAGAFLAFSGLESISQLSPVMRSPRRRVAGWALGLVVITIGLTSPLLTLWSTTVLPVTPRTDPNQFISLLGGFAGGQWLGWEVAISGALLLIFASNTAIIGSYHVFLALSRMSFFPRFIEQRNGLRDTPHWAIFLAVGIPVLVLALASGNIDLLGDLYAFGLLGAFSLTSLSLDIVRWRERHTGMPVMPDERNAPTSKPQGLLQRRIIFGLGVLTTVLVVLAWGTNLVHKPLATFFGGGVTLIGLVIAVVNYAALNRRGRPVVFPSLIRGSIPESVLAVLSAGTANTDALIRAAVATAVGRPIVFLYHGMSNGARRPRLFEVVDPYLEDRAAQDAFSRAEKVAKRLDLERRFVYVPAKDGPDGVTRMWQTIRPRDTLVAVGDEGVLHDVAPDRVRRPAGGAAPLLHYLKHWEPSRQ